MKMDGIVLASIAFVITQRLLVRGTAPKTPENCKYSCYINDFFY
jgi:hypothetical protein